MVEKDGLYAGMKKGLMIGWGWVVDKVRSALIDSGDGLDPEKAMEVGIGSRRLDNINQFEPGLAAEGKHCGFGKQIGRAAEWIGIVRLAAVGAAFGDGVNIDEPSGDSLHFQDQS